MKWRERHELEGADGLGATVSRTARGFVVANVFHFGHAWGEVWTSETIDEAKKKAERLISAEEKRLKKESRT